ETYLAKMGLTKTTSTSTSNVFYKNDELYISITEDTNEIIINPDMKLNEFFTNLGLKEKDIILAINDKNYTVENANEILFDSESWKDNTPITLEIRRDGIKQIINGIVKLPHEDKESFKVSDTSKTALKEAWLKG